MQNKDSQSQFDLENLREFLDQAVTPWHASRYLADILAASGFQSIPSNKPWPSLEAGQGYFYLREGSVFAFVHRPNAMLRMAYAHTDSPNLRVKLDTDKQQHGLNTVGIGVYGGALLNPWYDRPLGLAGQVSWVTDDKLHSKLVRLQDAIAFIPSLAIHLDRTANSNRSINSQTDMLAIYSANMNTVTASNTRNSEDDKRPTPTLQNIVTTFCKDNNLIPHNLPDDKLICQLCFFDNQPAATVGVNNEFLLSGRLDNLLSCYILVNSLIDSWKENSTEHLSVIACLDHEEIGSRSSTGGDGVFTAQLLQKITDNRLFSQHSNDYAISADNAHAIHPAYTKYHEPDYAPMMGRGPALKTEVNHRYATSLQTESRLRELAQKEGIPLQHFTARGDGSCGSTLGPILSSQLALSVVDIGIPQFAMHSSVESAHITDIQQTAKLIKAFFNDSSKVELD